MLGYVMVGTNDLEKSGKFYDAILSEIGAVRVMESDSFIIWSSGEKTTVFSIIKPNDGKAATVGNGVMMAFKAADQATVDKVHAKALELGGTCEGPVGNRAEFDPNFYVGYFRDLDGNKMNIYHHPTM